MFRPLRQLACLTTICAGIALLVSGCDVEPIPADPQPRYVSFVDAGEADGSTVCQAGATRCQGPRVVACRQDGSGFELERVCPSSTTCSEGRCVPVATSCEADPGESTPDFSTSKTRLVFETDDNLTTQTASVEVRNCSDSDIWLQRAEIRDPSPVAGRPIFSLVDSSDFQERSIPPGTVEEMVVRYEPRYAFSREPGQLRLQIIADEYREFDLPLVLRHHCVSATPSVELDLVNEAQSGSVFVHNCGTEDVELRDVEVVPDKPDERDQIHLQADPPAIPTQIAPGDTLEIPWELTPDMLGAFDHRIIYDVEDAERFTQSRLATQFRGRVSDAGCRNSQLQAPLITQDGQTREAWTIDADLGAPIEVSMQLPPDEEFDLSAPIVPVYRFDPPDGSRAEYEPGNEPFPTLGKNSLAPDVPGTYRIEMNYLDETATPLCEWQAATIEVRPRDDLFVDLHWNTREDAIDDDVGVGRGTDLNLHVVPADSDGGIDWAEPRADCFGYGEYPPAADHVGALDYELSECGSLGGRIESVSASGAHRELVGFSNSTLHARYYVAIHGWSMSGFPGADAVVRLWHDGKRVDSFAIDEARWEHHERPADLSTLLSRTVASPDRVLILGYWDTQNETFVVAPPTRFSGFPSSH